MKGERHVRDNKKSPGSLVKPMMPARPPKIASSTSKKSGEVRASSSVVTVLSGEIRKNTVEVPMLIRICIAKPDSARLSTSRSSVTTPYAIRYRLPMSGEISIAPMMAAVEFLMRPMDATMIAIMRMTRFVPVTLPAEKILSRTSYGSDRDKRNVRKSLDALNEMNALFADDKGWNSEEEMIKDMADLRRSMDKEDRV